MLAHWNLDPDLVYLNHGTVGAVPKRVLAAQRAIQDDIERNPARALLRELTQVRVGKPTGVKPRLRRAADELAPFFGARGDDLLFVDNATTGVNAVLRSLRLSAGDVVLRTDHGYGGVNNAARFVAREAGAEVHVVELPDPIERPEQVTAALAAALAGPLSGRRVRVAIVDHIVSDSSLIFPIHDIAGLLRAHGVPLLVDGAHAPGAIPLDIPSVGADWYVGNLHKWLWAPRASAILWVAPDRHEGLHPTVISHGLDLGLSAEFDLVGTRDPSPHLTVGAALALRREFGGEAAIQAYNHGLVWEAGHRLAARWGTRWEPAESLVGPMATLPLPAALGSTMEDAAAVRDALFAEDGIELHVGARHGTLRIRIAAQIYNEPADFDRLGDAVARRLQRVAVV
jgi:isopenicillin-N epimerase